MRPGDRFDWLEAPAYMAICFCGMGKPPILTVGPQRGKPVKASIDCW